VTAVQAVRSNRQSDWQDDWAEREVTQKRITAQPAQPAE
jgi:hypothetical protein